MQIEPPGLARLLRSAALLGHRAGRVRTTTCRRIWHDTPAADLREHGLGLSEQGGVWRLERLVANPACPAAVLAEGADTSRFHRRLTPPVLASLIPVAALTGTQRAVPLTLGGQPGSLHIIEGTLRGVARDEPICRLYFTGAGSALGGLASTLAVPLPLSVPPASLAACAIAVGLGVPPACGRLGGPEVSPGMSVGGALPLVIAQLTRVLLHWGRQIAGLAASENGEPVHQMRVAARRLRAALAVFRRAVGAPEGAALFRALADELKTLAALLGEARDWDVFLSGDGVAIGRAFGGDRRVSTLLRTAGRKRMAAYAALRAHFATPEWRQLGLRLALLPITQPWVRPPPAHPERDEYGQLLPPEAHGDLLGACAQAYAAHALQRAFRRVTAAGQDMSALSPEAMHDARKRAKSLRYACEFFAPLFPAKAVRRFLERLEDVQEALGAVNDGHVAAALMGRIAGTGEARFASGVVQGYVAAARAPAARQAGRAWAKLLGQEVFWG